MDIRKLSLVIPAIMLMSSGVFADERGQQAPRYYQDQDQEQDQGSQYQDECGGGGCQPGLPPVYGAPCGGCGFNPGINYFCGVQCAPPVLPYPQPIIPVPLPAPIYGGPVYGGPGYGGPGYGGPGYGGGGYGGRVPWPGPRPGYGGGGYRPGWGGGRPGYGGPGFGGPGGMRPRRMSATGCSVSEGSVFSSEGQEIFKSDISSHAQENAEYMKSYYEKNVPELCGSIKSPAKSLDI